MMEHLSDKHQTSSMSGISMISGANSMPCPGLTNFSSKYSSQRSIQQGLGSPYQNLTKNNNQSTKINQALSECKGIIAEFVIKKLIFDCLSEVTSKDNQTVKKELDRKLKQIIVFQDTDKYVHLPNNFDSTNCKLTLLGITDFPKIELLSNEKSDIKCLVEKTIQERICGIIARYTELGGNLQELQPKEGPLINHHASMNCFDMNLLQWKEKLEQLCEDYEKNVSKYNALMREWIDLKYEYFNNLQFKKAESLLINIQVSEARAKIAKLNAIFKMYQETPVTLTAYRLIDSNLNAKIAEMKEEINKKEMSKTLYDQLKGTEYDEVVDQYGRLCNGIEKKKFILRNM